MHDVGGFHAVIGPTAHGRFTIIGGKSWPCPHPYDLELEVIATPAGGDLR